MTDDLPIDALEELANLEIGEALRLTRSHYGKSLNDIEKSLHIRACQINAIECGDIDQLPGRVYAIGFVRAYAEHLGLDGAKAVQLFKAQYMDGQGRASLSFHIPVIDLKAPAFWIVAISFFTFLIYSSLWKEYVQLDRHLIMAVGNVPDEMVAHVQKNIFYELSEDQEMRIAQINGVEDELPVEDMGTKSDDQQGIILNLIGQSWVEIKNVEGLVVVSDILEEGDQYFVPNSPGLSMSLGNAANVEIIVGGRTLKPLGGQGDVRKSIPLDVSYLQTLEFQVVEVLH